MSQQVNRFELPGGASNRTSLLDRTARPERLATLSETPSVPPHHRVRRGAVRTPPFLASPRDVLPSLPSLLLLSSSGNKGSDDGFLQKVIKAYDKKHNNFVKPTSKNWRKDQLRCAFGIKHYAGEVGGVLRWGGVRWEESSSRYDARRDRARRLAR